MAESQEETKEVDLYFDVEDKLPIVYRNEYNIRVCHIEKCHPFDAGKWGNVYKVSDFIQ